MPDHSPATPPPPPPISVAANHPLILPFLVYCSGIFILIIIIYYSNEAVVMMYWTDRFSFSCFVLLSTLYFMELVHDNFICVFPYINSIRDIKLCKILFILICVELNRLTWGWPRPTSMQVNIWNRKQNSN